MASDDAPAPPPPLGALQRLVTDPAQNDDITNNTTNNSNDANNTTDDIDPNEIEAPEKKKVSFVDAAIKNSPEKHVHLLGATMEIDYDFSDTEAFSGDENSDVDTDDEYHLPSPKESDNETDLFNSEDVKQPDATRLTPALSAPDASSTRVGSKSVGYGSGSGGSNNKPAYERRTSSANITQAERKRRQSARLSHLLDAKRLTIYGSLRSDQLPPDIASSNDDSLEELDRDPTPMSLHFSESKTADTNNNNNNELMPENPPDLRVKHKSMMEARDYIEKEVISTEETYVEGLRVLTEEFYDSIFAEKLIKEKHQSDLESNIRIIYKFHIVFLDLLKKGPIPKVFNSQADFLKMYTQYVNDYDGILNKFGSFRGNKKLQAFLRAKRKQRKPLTNHLILPIQRVPRYTLLLTDLKKHTPQEHEDYEELCEALNKIDKISKLINERKREIENMSQCLQVQENLKDLNESIVAPHRRFLKQYYFFRKRKARQFFLFNDILIISDDKWHVKQQIEMRSIAVRRDTSEQTVFTVYSAKKPKDYNTEVEEDIDEFIKVVEKYRVRVWEGDVSRLSKHGGNVLKQLLNEQGVSQDQQYRQQVSDKKREKLANNIQMVSSLGLGDAAHKLKKDVGPESNEKTDKVDNKGDKGDKKGKEKGRMFKKREENKKK